MADEEDIPSLTLRLLRELHTKVDRLEARMDRLEARMDRMESAFGELQRDVFELRVSLRQLDDRVTRLETEMRAGFAGVMHVVASSHAGLDARVTKLEQR